MAGRTPISINTKKARVWDAKVCNERENSIAGMERSFGYRPRKVSVEYECQVAILHKHNVEVPVHREPTDEERQAAKERIRAYRLSIIRERRGA